MPGEHPFVLEVDDRAGDLPLAHVVALVASEEACTDGGFVVEPLGALELVAEPGRQVDVGDVWPEVGRLRVDVDLDGDAGAVGVDGRASVGRVLEGAPPLVEPGDLPGGAALYGGEVVADGEGDGQQHDLGDAIGDVEQVGDLVGGGEVEGGPGGPEAPRSGGKAEAPGGLDDRVAQARAAAAVVGAVDRDQHEDRDFVEVVGAVAAGTGRPLPGGAAPGEGAGARGQPGAAGLPVEGGDLLPDLRIPDDEPTPAGLVAAGRRLFGEVDAVEDQLLGDRSFQVQAPSDRPCRREQAIGLAGVEGHARVQHTSGVRGPVGAAVEVRPGVPRR